ncbi:MAG: hypothetical protein GX640_19665 [Fibrobacter sp.]|nr:hypothetical protein [Fibrobacter sp.]
MIEDLEDLKQLQEIDLRIREQELAQEQYPAAVAELEDAINKAKASVDSFSSKLAKAEKDRAEFEDQIAKSKDLLEKSQSRLNSIKTNREYDAVHAEIESQKNTLNQAETRKKNLQDEIERWKTAVEQHTAELEKIKSENEPQIAELKRKIAAIDSTIAEITKERDAVAPRISKPLIRTYDLIRKKRKSGRAISNVNSSRTCTVCYKVLEPQLYNEIRRGLKMILCQNCGSILIWDESTVQH